jgi:L-seryl-tRNA(Ser) seleniumtransferase
MASGLAATRGVCTERFVPEIANNVPHLRIRWDPDVVKISHADAVRQLREGDSSIEPVPGSYVKDTLEFVHGRSPGEAKLSPRRTDSLIGNTADASR